MKALVLEEYNQFALKDVPKPEPKRDEVLIQVKACGICGSDVHGMDGSTGRRIPPVIMGHEASGVIESVGTEVAGWQVGDRVTFDSTIYKLDDWYTRKGLYNLSDNRQVLGVSAQEFKKDGAFAEYVTVPSHILYKIPDNVSFEQAAMVEPVSVAAHAVSLTPIVLQDKAMVVGAGMIGQFIIQILRNTGVGMIIAVDIDDNKLEMAQRFGADKTLNPKHDKVHEEIMSFTGNRGPDIALEAVGIQDTIITSLENVRKGGTVTLVGNLAPKAEIPVQKIVTSQLRVQGSYAIAGEYPAVLEMIVQGKVNVEPMLSAVAPLEEGEAWLKRLHNNEPGLYKVILKP